VVVGRAPPRSRQPVRRPPRHPLAARGDGPPQVLVPQLGRPLEDELADDGALRLSHASDGLGDGNSAGHTGGDGGGEDGYRIVYHEHVWPVRPGSLAAVGLDPDDVAGTLATVDADRGRMFSLLLQQHYRLVHWRRANHDLNYRRFFDITTLGGVRIEDPAVFEDAHRRILELVADGSIDGLRIDHPDGLRDPSGYFERLRDAAPDAWIVAEKILEPGETRRRDWRIDGTVGYEYSNRTLGLFVDPDSESVLDDLWATLQGGREPTGTWSTTPSARSSTGCSPPRSPTSPRCSPTSPTPRGSWRPARRSPKRCARCWSASPSTGPTSAPTTARCRAPTAGT
jgi:hypothetical protein